MQKSSRTRFFVLASAALVAVGLPFAGCTLITEVDRSLIPDGQAGASSSGGSSSGGSNGEGGASSGGTPGGGGSAGEGGADNEGGAGGA